jgi:site-specific recombinase XerD
MEHSPASALDSSYVNWIAYRRFVILLAEQQAGTLTSWKHYMSQKIEMPATKEFVDIVALYREHLTMAGLYENTVKGYSKYVRCLLMYLEGQGITKISKVQNKDIAGYFTSSRFTNRRPKGIQTEACALKNFTKFLVDKGYNKCETLCYSIPRYRVPMERIITTLTPEMISDIMEDEPNSLVNKRDIAVGLLALRVGLRGCDIRNLKFNNKRLKWI